MVSQRTRQLIMQKTAIKLASRSAVRNFESSARQPDFKILWNTLDFPTHRVPVDLLNRFGAPAHGKIGDQLPFDRLSALRRAAFTGVDHRKIERGISLLLANGRLDHDAPELDFQRDFCDFALVVSHFDAMQSP